MTDAELARFKGRTVAVAMSGGADSSLTAALLLDAGARVTGFTMRLWKFGEGGAGGGEGQAVADARAVAARLGIRHVALDLRAPFRRAIVQPFAEAYAAGRTPSPCMECNPLIKFGALLEAALAEGCEFLATGHYARLEVAAAGEVCLRRGLDPHKDQAYFLARVPVERLRRAIFPLGDRRKPEVVAAAAARGILRPASTESQDLCFLPNGAYAQLVAELHPELARPGEIVTADGRVLGRHDGFFRYTCGQRRGLGLGGGPWYVLRVEPATNRVVVGGAAEAECRTVRVTAVNWLVPPPAAPLPAHVQLRYKMTPVPAVVTPGPDQSAVLTLEKPLAGVAPGQGAVFYDGDRVLGGGWIAAAGAADAV